MNSINDSSLCSRKNNNTPAYLTLALLCAPFWACGGGSSSPSSPTPVAVATPTPCAQTVQFQGSGDMPAGTLMSLPLTVPSSGRLDVTADWTLTSNSVGLYVAQGACSLAQFNARTCTFVIRLEPGAKPLKGSGSVTAGVVYGVLLSNFGTRDDSGTLQVVLSTGSCAAAGGPTGSASTGVTPAAMRIGSFAH